MANGADPVAGIAQVLSVFVGAATATALAPHLVVLIAGMAGGVFGLMSWRPCTAWEGMAYVASMGCAAWLVTGTFAELVGLLSPLIGDRRGLAPIALTIGWIGHRWPAVLRWAGQLAKRWVEAAIHQDGKTK